MRIAVTQTFLDGRHRFEAGDICTVADEDGARFILNGWAISEGMESGAENNSAPVSLDVQNVTHAQGVRHG